MLITPTHYAGAHNRIRTGDLFLTKEVLYRLSYMGLPISYAGIHAETFLASINSGPDICVGALAGKLIHWINFLCRLARLSYMGLLSSLPRYRRP